MTGTVALSVVSVPSKMFNQTFVHTTHTGEKPTAIGISLLLQLAILFVLAVLPLVYTDVLPKVDLRRLLIAPPPPSALPRVIEQREQTSVRLTPRRFVFSPSLTNVVPRRSNAAETVSAPAPDVDTGNSSGDANATNNGIFGVPGSVPGPPPPPPTPSQPPSPKTVRIGSGVSEANLIYRVQPIYPALAKTTRVQGLVEFTATISKDGKIENLQLVHGHPLLVKAAKDAVLQWKYKPTILNGQPVEVITSILVNFTLTQ